MKKSTAAFAFAAACIAWGAYASGDVSETTMVRETMDNEDVLMLAEAGLTDTLILAKIYASDTAFDTSAEALIALDEAGLDEAVLLAMTQARTKSAHRDTPDHFAGTPCPDYGVYYDDKDTLRRLDTTGLLRIGDSGMVSQASDAAYGLLPNKTRASIEGVSAKLRVDNAQPSFWFCFDAPDPQLIYRTSGVVDPRGFTLVSFQIVDRREERRFEIGKFSMFGGGMGPSKRQFRATEYQQVAPGVYRVALAETLEPGEYGFYYGAAPSLAAFEYIAVSGSAAGNVFSFGIDGERD